MRKQYYKSSLNLTGMYNTLEVSYLGVYGEVLKGEAINVYG
jgi:hypothetical protein